MRQLSRLDVSPSLRCPGKDEAVVAASLFNLDRYLQCMFPFLPRTEKALSTFSGLLKSAGKPALRMSR